MWIVNGFIRLLISISAKMNNNNICYNLKISMKNRLDS